MLGSKSQVVVVPDGLSVTSSEPGREKNEMEIFVQDDPFIPSVLCPHCQRPPSSKPSTERENRQRWLTRPHVSVPVMRPDTDGTQRQSRDHQLASAAAGA